MDKKKKIISTVVMVLGFAALVVGAVFLILKLTAKPKVADGDYLVEAGNWVLEDGTECTTNESGTDSAEVRRCTPSVIWHFTEIGKGTLTTNDHVNDYDFAWAIDGDKLTIRTNWLYELNDQYTYKLDQTTGTLTLSSGQQEYKFTAAQ